jgi:hypothetical protein
MKKVTMKKVYKPKIGSVSMACTKQSGYAR